MTNGRNWAIGSVILAAMLFAVAYQCVPQPRTLTEAATPTIRVIVLPEQTPTPTTLPMVTVTPTPADALPMTPESTRVPTLIPPPVLAEPTRTVDPLRTPVQKG